MEWYYADSGQRVGPITETDLQSLYVSGKVKPDTLVWNAGMQDWQPFSTAQPVLGAPAGNGQFCTECGRPSSSSDLLAFGAARVCADCKDVFFQRVRERGSAAAGTPFMRYAGFWIRFLAVFIDGLILGVFFSIIEMILFLIPGRGIFRTLQNPPISPPEAGLILGGIAVSYLIFFAATIAYQSWFVAHRGGTPGKLAVGLRVVRSDGASLTMGRSIGRAFAYVLNNLTFGIGFIIAAFDSQKRALHDHVCDTRVIHKSA
jgi:uncharacterized RDD family membrane protein YckC